MNAPPVVGVLGGSFDPVHVGHLALAEAVRRALPLSRVLLLPCAVPPHKPQRLLGAAEHRAAMLRLALEDHPGLELCTLELERGGVCYTIDTLRTLRRSQPPRDPVFLLGMDSLVELPTWRFYPQLLAEFDWVALDRAGSELEQVRSRLDEEVLSRLRPDLSGLGDRPLGSGGRVLHLAVTPPDVSSSEVRARAAASESLDGLVPPAVARYIHREGLYRPRRSVPDESDPSGDRSVR
ncbi:MAG TPA: nicotinate (nicotinamide) nucleotide adenylyltransferase [Candidatus Polarisedimenticolaceae bacterium]|nr:nicotinate (nicotinamide) nucleotide adenylyltransferase [Candidatus Polarisedimenticolaceae bacterium]